MIIHIVRFTSALPAERIQDLFTARTQQYTGVPGLLQKYYLRYDNAQHGAVYVWDCPESMQAFRASELSRSIHDVYQVTESTLDVAEVVLALRPQPALASTGPDPARHPAR
jgi:hypothetical protein